MINRSLITRSLLVAAALLSAAAVRAGYVQTAAGRLEGKVTLGKDHVAVDDKTVPWSEVLYLLPDGAGKLSRPHRVRFKSGEVWAGKLLGITDKQIEVRSGLFGTRKAPLDTIAALDFLPQPPAQRDPRPNTLYRAKGEPIPGTLLGLTTEKLTMSSPLGDLSLPRDGLARYVFSTEPAKPPKEFDEVALIDGSILHGRLHPTADGFELGHADLGRIKFPASALRSLVRHTAVATDLTGLAPKSAETAPLIGSGTQPGRVAVLRGETFIKAVRVEPKTVVRYALPPRDGNKAELRFVLAPIGGAKGDVRLRVRVGNREVLDKELPAGERPRPVSVELPAGGELVIEADFGERLRFPCGVLLIDPHLVLK